jgi:hypothetical protein
MFQLDPVTEEKRQIDAGTTRYIIKHIHGVGTPGEAILVDPNHYQS